MITPATCEEWADALARWIGRRSIMQVASETSFGRHSLHIWLRHGKLPRRQDTRDRLRDIAGIDLDPLWSAHEEERRMKSRNFSESPAQYASREAEAKRAIQALRDSGGYGPHDLTEALRRRQRKAA